MVSAPGFCAFLSLKKKNLILGFYVPKPTSDYEARHGEGLGMNFYHLGFFNVQSMQGTQAFLDFTFPRTQAMEEW